MEFDVEDERDDNWLVSFALPDISSDKRLNDWSLIDRTSIQVKIRF